jgi:hypothetical protein
MAQTVYVLGAGASHGDTLRISDEKKWKKACKKDRNTEVDHTIATNPPLITSFFDANYLWWTYPERIEKLFPEMINYIRRRWGIKGVFGTGDWLNVNLEDIFTSAAIDVEFNPPGTNAHAESQLLLNQIKRHVSFILGRCTIYRYGKHSRALVNALDENDTIINFNYDLLIDQEVISRTGIYQYHNFANVVLDKPFQNTPQFRALRDKQTGSGLYLKMHGSLNWTTCTNNACPRSTSIEIGDVLESLLSRNSPTGRPPRCETCRSEVSTVLIPPLLNKPVMHSSIFRNIWSNALYTLSQAKKIIIIGYSFPPTDFYTEWLFRSARIHADTQVQIINPLNNPAHPNRREQERFNRMTPSLFPHGYDGQLTAFNQMQFNS